MQLWPKTKTKSSNFTGRAEALANEAQSPSSKTGTIKNKQKLIFSPNFFLSFYLLHIPKQKP